MKKNYILKNYDKIVDYIKNQNRVSKLELIKNIQALSNESKLIYEIVFSNNNQNPSFTVNKPIHILHPNALRRLEPVNELLKEYQKIIPKVIDQLNIHKQDYNIMFDPNLEKTNIFISVNCDLDSLSKQHLFFLYCSVAVAIENNKIKKQLKLHVFKQDSAEKTQYYIHKAQYAFENLATKIIKDIKPNSTLDLYNYSFEYNQNDCLKVTYVFIEKLLRFVEKEYANFLNENIRIPYRTILFKEFEINPKLNFVKATLLELNINKKLLQIVYQPVLKLSTINIDDKLTYQEFNYSVEIIEELYKLFQNKSKSFINQKIIYWLIELNFNEPEFLIYITEKYKMDLNKIEIKNSRIDYLYKKLKEINQIQIIIHNKWNNKIPEIKTQLIKWLEEEIQYKKNKIVAIDKNHFEVENNTKFKLNLSISVSQLAWFINILIKTKIIKTTNQKEVIRFFAANCKTENQENISADSLSAKYYNTEQSAKEVIKNKIIEMLNYSK